jgi:hypothetical protein
MPVPIGYPSGLPTVPEVRYTSTRELFRADGLVITAGGNTVTGTTANQVNGVTTGIIDVSGVAAGLLIINVSAVSGTSTPTLAVFFDVQDYYGNWSLVSNSTSVGGTAITATGVVSGVISANTVAAFNGRIRWTVSGTTPSFTCSFDLFGR